MVTLTSAVCITVVVTLEVLFALLESGVAVETVAVFVIDAGAFAFTFTTSVNVSVTPVARAVPRVQLMVPVPPGVKHSWKPDPGTKLVAVQFYSPPGPEQRFKALAAAAADAGKKP